MSPTWYHLPDGWKDDPHWLSGNIIQCLRWPESADGLWQTGQTIMFDWLWRPLQRAMLNSIHRLRNISSTQVAYVSAAFNQYIYSVMLTDILLGGYIEELLLLMAICLLTYEDAKAD